MDIKATRWHDDYNVFKRSVKDLEIMMQNIIMSAFECAATIENCVELLEIFHHLAKREAIKRTVEKKTTDVYNLFFHELNAVKVEFESHRKTPEIFRFHPDFAGSGYWAKSLHRRIVYSYGILSAAYYLPKTSLSDEVKMQYDPLVAALEDYIQKTHQEWVASIDKDLANRLDEKLMTRKQGENGENFLEMKFDKDILRVFAEIHYWQKLKLDVPFHVQEIYGKREELRVLRENVLLVVRDYNDILVSLTADEHKMFKERIRFLDRKMNPGLTSLTWISKGITEYFVKECRRHSHDVKATVTEFLDANVSIQKNLRTISDTLLWKIENKKVYDLDDFERLQSDYRIVARDKLLNCFDNIKQTLTSMFEVFRNDGREVYHHWVLYVEKIDKSVEEALRMTIKRSLQEISKSINGEGKSREGATEIHPLFKVNVVLELQKVDVNPNLGKLEETVNRVFIR